MMKFILDSIYYSLILVFVGLLCGLTWIIWFNMTNTAVANCRYNYGRYSIWNKECKLPGPKTEILFENEQNSFNKLN